MRLFYCFQTELIYTF